MALFLGALVIVVACSSNTKPKALPPQTMAPKPPEMQQPVSTAPQELEPDEISTPTEAADSGAPTATPQAPVQVPAETRPEADPTVMVIESAGGEGTKAEASLFEAAEAERARRETSGESTIVLDDKTLKQYSKGKITYLEEETPQGSSSGAPSTGAPSTGADDPEPGEGVAEAAEGSAAQREAGEAGSDPEASDEAEELWRQEQYWRNRVLDIRIGWRESLDRIGELEQDIATLRRDFYAEDDPFYRDSQIKPAWDFALEELEESKRIAERRQVELEEVLDEGRRQGALPGWLREGIELEPSQEELTETLEEQGEFHEPSEPVIVDDDGGRRDR